jgi:hypothetical protein
MKVDERTQSRKEIGIVVLVRFSEDDQSQTVYPLFFPSFLSHW